MILHKHGERLYNGLIDTLTTHLQAIARQIEEKEGVSFLAELKKHWDDHNKSTQMIRDILMVRPHTLEIYPYISGVAGSRSSPRCGLRG